MVSPAREGTGRTELKVLLVHENKEVVNTIKMCVDMEWKDSSVKWASRGSGVPERIQSESPDIVLLQLDLPDIDGLEVLTNIREFSKVPVVALSTDSRPETLVLSLESGADRFLPEPFDHTLLRAEMHTALRQAGFEEWGVGRMIRLGDFLIDLNGRRLLKNGENVPLTPLQWNFLAYFARNRGKIIPQKVIAEKVWGAEEVSESAIKMCVLHMRKKLGDNPRRPKYLKSHRGMGYSLAVS